MGLSLADFDPTNASSAFGGDVAGLIGEVPGGSATLTLADRLGTASAANDAAARQRAAGSTGAMPPFSSSLLNQTTVLYAGIAIVVVLAVVLIAKK